MQTKSILFTALCVTLIALSACSGKSKSHDGQDDATITEMKVDAKAKKYPMERGVIYQKSVAMGIVSEPVIYFDRWGEWEVTETTTIVKMMGISDTTITREITKGDDYWKIEMTENKGVHYKRPAMMSALGVDVEKVSKEMLGEMNLEELGEETFLGYKCKKYRFTSDKGMSMDYLMYGNLMMKMKGEAMGLPVETEVTRIETVTPPADKFEIPEGMAISDY